MTVQRDITVDDYLRMPRLDREEIKLLSNFDYWDGPLSGMLLYRGEKYLYELGPGNFDEDVDELAVASDRKYLVVELPNEQLAEIEHWNNLFIKYVADYSNEAGHIGTGVKPQEITTVSQS